MKSYLKKYIPQKGRTFLRKLYQNLSWPFYLGLKYSCPCCKTKFRKLLPFWGRKNTRCPRCSSIDRYRLLWLYLQDRTSILSEKLKILHFAPEAALSRNLKRQKNLHYITADSYASFIDGICTKPDYILDIGEIGFPDNSFDVVICNHVLEHVKDDLRAMREIYRVLKKKGWAILQVPIDQSIETTLEDSNVVSIEERNRLYGSPHHVRLYGKDYITRLQNVGFRVRVDPYVRLISPLKINKYCLNPYEDIYVASKE